MAGLKTINHVDMRNRNITIIVNYLYRYAPISRASLARKSGLNKATVTSIIRVLIENGFVIETGKSLRKVIGHPATALQVNPDAARVIGAEIRAEEVVVAVMDLSPAILWRESQTIQEGQKAVSVIDQTLRLLNKAYYSVKYLGIPVLGIVVSLPGLVDLSTNTLIDAPGMGWKNVPVGEMIQREIHLPLAIGNSAHMGSIAENYFGASKDSEVSLYLNLGSTLSSGIVIMDSVLSGAAGLASEAGHMTIDPHGEKCACGNSGCWDTVASQRALLKRVRYAIQRGQPSLIQEVVGGELTKITFSHVLEAAKVRDEVALRAFEETGCWLGVGLSGLINLLNPETIILGGSMSAGHEFLLPAIEEEIQKRAFVGAVKDCQISLAKYGEDSSLLGSLAVVYWNLLNQLQYITLSTKELV